MVLLFCNVGWMERYQGLQSGDQIVGGGAYVKVEGRGHEICNFSSHDNVFYGYVQPPGQQINIERIGANPTDDSVSDVTVIWTATRPTGGTAVIGWYKDATVFRNYQTFLKAPSIQQRNGIDGYWIKAPSDQAKLLQVDERTCEIPRQVKGGMGQANIWYADSPESAIIVERVMDFIKGKKQKLPYKKGSAGVQNQERKVQIERAAIRACCEYFESFGYSINSVEKDNLGWDLEAQSGKSILRIEVKGLSGNSFAVELTPNEYKAFSEQSASYRLVVVINALKEPELFVCRYSGEQKKWLIEGGECKSLEIQIKQSASIKCI